jgi:hypothetical protein
MSSAGRWLTIVAGMGATALGWARPLRAENILCMPIPSVPYTVESHVVVYGLIDQIGPADEVRLVVEAADEMAQALRGVGREMVHVIESDARRRGGRRARGP